MDTETLPYAENHQGYVAYPSTPGKAPAVIIAPAFRGLDDFARNKAEQVAELGYVGFAADIYGEGTAVNNNEEAGALMMPLFLGRKELRRRMVAAYEAATVLERVDSSHIAALGFCFGGLAAQELLRSGAKLCGVVSFHGLLGDTLGGQKAQIEPNAETLHGSLLILHGNDDPLVSQEDINHAKQEWTEAGIDWQMHIYGNTSHAFTNPEAKEADSGLMYNPVADKRSWQTFQNFTQEIFS